MVTLKFGTDGWRAIIADEFTVENVRRVAAGTAKWLVKNYPNPSVVVGHDCRFAGRLFTEHTAEVLANNGIKVYIANNAFVSTPMISSGIIDLKTDAGVIITASHNPPNYNGYKLKANYGGPALSSMIAEVENYTPDSAPFSLKSYKQLHAEGAIIDVDLEDLYCKKAEAAFDFDAIKNSGMRLAYDAMYGSGQNVIRRLLPDSQMLHCEHNPLFGGTPPEPLMKNLGELSTLMKNSPNLDLGLATDGDADRIGLMNADGKFIDSHHIILLLVLYTHKYKGQTGKVCFSFSNTQKLKRLCEFFEIPYEVCKIGFKNICEIMIKENVMVGGEESGGIAINGFIPERDGIWIGLVLLEFMAKTGKTLDELIEEVYSLVGPFAMERYDLHIDNDIKLRTIEMCKNNGFTEFNGFKITEKEDLDGYKFHLGNDRWVMFRASGTEPVLRLYAESESMEMTIAILESAKKQVLA